MPYDRINPHVLGSLSNAEYFQSSFAPILINVTKGQLISKCPYEKSVLSKIPTKKFPRFLF